MVDKAQFHQVAVSCWQTYETGLVGGMFQGGPQFGIREQGREVGVSKEADQLRIDVNGQAVLSDGDSAGVALKSFR